MNCVVIINERTSIPRCIIKSQKILPDETLKDHAKQWMHDHNDNCSWSNYRCVIMNINDAPKLQNVYTIQIMLEVIVGEHIDFGRLEYWKWWFPTDNYHPSNNGRIHLIGKFFWRTI